MRSRRPASSARTMFVCRRLRFRGRELSHQELGMRQLERIREDLADIGVVEQMPRLEGRQMVMVIAPKKSK